MSKKSMEDAWDAEDTGAMYPGKRVLKGWWIACEQHLGDLRRETGALEYSSVRSKTHHNSVALRPTGHVWM
jgi:hypothetical protein